MNEALEQLNNRKLELRDAAVNVQARADAEKRELTSDEKKEVDEIFASYDSVKEEIARREQLESINAELSAPMGRKVNPEIEDVEPQAKATEKPGTKIYATPRSQDANKWGFRSQAEFFDAVARSSAKGAQTDPRLIANSPSTYGSEGVGADGGFAVPPEFRAAIMQKVMGEDSLLSMTDQQQTSGNAITFLADETTPWQSSGGIQSYWESEASQMAQSKPQLVEKTVKANKIITLVPLSDELLADAPAMASYVNRKAPEKINFRVNDAILNGSGAGTPLGILKSPGTVEVAKEASQTADTVNYNNIIKMYSALTPTARAKARWIVNPDIEQQLMTMSFPGTGTAVPVYLPPGGLSASPYGTLLGRPIITSEACSALGDKGDIIFGDMSSYLSVVKVGGIRSDVSIHVWFDWDITAFRFILRVGGQPWWNSTIAAFKNGSSARGFFATLADRA